jgi:hypothetical protein
MQKHTHQKTLDDILRRGIVEELRHGYAIELL